MVDFHASFASAVARRAEEHAEGLVRAIVRDEVFKLADTASQYATDPSAHQALVQLRDAAVA